LMEILKQPLYHPKSMAEQVIILYVANQKLLLDVELENATQFATDLIEHFKREHKDILDEINTKKVMSDELAQKIKDITIEFKK